MSFPFFIALTVAALLSWSTYAFFDQRAFARRHGCHPPAARSPASRLVGGADYIVARICSIVNHGFADGIRDLFHQLGDTFVVNVMGLPIVHTIAPENLRAIMNTSARDYAVLPQRETLVSTVFGKGVLAASGAHWAASRSVVRTALNKTTFDDAAFLRHADGLVDDILARPPGQHFDFNDHISRYLMDLTTDLYFAESTRDTPGSAPHARASAFASNFRYLAQMARDVTLSGNMIPLVVNAVYGRPYRRAKAAVEAIVDSYLAPHMATSSFSSTAKSSTSSREPPRTTLASAIAVAAPSLATARTETLNLLLAGNDTVGINLSEPTYLLAQHPHAYAKLRAAVRAELGDAPPTLAALKRIPYLRHVIAESVRLRPTLSVHGRVAARHTVLPRGGGPHGAAPLMVPRGSYVLYSTHALHRAAGVFGPDADAFRPERWAAGLAPARFEYMPFGGGARQCPGEKLGWNMVAFALARVAQRVPALRSVDTRGWSEATAFSFHNRHGVWVTVDMEGNVEGEGEGESEALLDEGYASGVEEKGDGDVAASSPLALADERLA